MLELPTVVPYFDLSLQHADAALLRRMKRWGSGDRFLTAIDAIRAQEPDAAFRSSFIVGFPGETEREHDDLLEFLSAAALDWAGFFPFSPEDGTPAATLPDAVDPDLAFEWLRECEAVQEPITRAARDALVGREIEVLVDAPDAASDRGGQTSSSVARTAKHPRSTASCSSTPSSARPGALVRAHVTEAIGPDLVAKAHVPRQRRKAREHAAGHARASLQRRSHRDPGQHGDDRAPRARRPHAAADRRPGFELAHGVAVVRAHHHRRPRRLARPPRRHHPFGAFLDPLADKFLVLGGFFALGINGDFSWAAVLIVTVREVGVSLYRSYAARHGISLPARRLGKWKAFFQFLAVGVVLLPPTYEWATFHDVLLWFAVGLSVVSGLDIVISGQRVARAASRTSSRKDPNAV